MLVSLIAFAALAPKSISLIPKETIWVYANASTPGDGTFLRAWGVDGKSCQPDGEDAGQFSYSYLKWDVDSLPKGAKLISAKLVLNQTPDPGYSVEAAKKSPVEVRPILGDFSVKTWSFDMSLKNRPDGGEKAMFGTGYPKEIKKEVPVPISIDLLAGPNNFTKALADAQSSSAHFLNLSITAKLDPSTEGRTFVYKFFGQNESKEWLRPQLVLEFEN